MKHGLRCGWDVGLRRRPIRPAEPRSCDIRARMRLSVGSCRWQMGVLRRPGWRHGTSGSAVGTKRRARRAATAAVFRIFAWQVSVLRAVMTRPVPDCEKRDTPRNVRRPVRIAPLRQYTRGAVRSPNLRREMPPALTDSATPASASARRGPWNARHGTANTVRSASAAGNRRHFRARSCTSTTGCPSCPGCPRIRRRRA